MWTTKNLSLHWVHMSEDMFPHTMAPILSWNYTICYIDSISLETDSFCVYMFAGWSELHKKHLIVHVSQYIIYLIFIVRDSLLSWLIYFILYVYHAYTSMLKQAFHLSLSLALWVNSSADDILKYFIFPRKQDLTFHANCH